MASQREVLRNLYADDNRFANVCNGCEGMNMPALARRPCGAMYCARCAAICQRHHEVNACIECKPYASNRR
jgi:hypothetical protein